MLDKEIKIAKPSFISRPISVVEWGEYTARISKRNYDEELSRQESILTQSSRVLVFITIIITAFVGFISFIIEQFEIYKKLIWLFTIIIISLLLISMILLLLSQWRYCYIVTPLRAKIESYSKKDIVRELDKYECDKIFYDRMAASLKNNNDKRVLYLNIATIIIVSVLLLSLLLFFYCFFKVGENICVKIVMQNERNVNALIAQIVARI